MEDSILSIIAAVLIFFIWYFSKDKKKGKITIDDVIKNDPVLNKLDKEIENINKEAEVKSVTEETAGLPDHLANALNKDYSQVMKKVDEKQNFNKGPM